jgi:acyl-CoA reductase-like NAD-dependent aldehyde dehydrogenase
MTELLANHLGGRWTLGSGGGAALFDPVLGNELVRVDATGLDLAGGFAHARRVGGAGLRALTYGQRAERLGAIAKVLQANRDTYYEISTANSGTTKADSGVDIDGAIYTLGVYAKLGATLPDAPFLPSFLLDGDATALAKGGAFASQHVQVPTRGLALFINAFNFPAWGLWEKAAPALLSGVPVVVKPATATAWLTQRMVADVIASGLLPAGALSVICGSAAGLLEQLRPFDVLSFTGSAQTAALLRAHPAVVANSVRLNIEADSLNAALLMPDAAEDSEAFAAVRPRGRARDHDQVRPEVHGHPPRARAAVAVRSRRRRDRGEARRRQPSAIRGTRRCGWARSSAASSSTACSPASRTPAGQTRCCTTAARSRSSMPTRGRRVRGPDAARRATTRTAPMSCIAWRSSAPSPR